jgi:hypothetical protein
MNEKKNTGGPSEARREDDAGEKDGVESRVREQWKILELFGTIDFDPDYDYKADVTRLRVGL